MKTKLVALRAEYSDEYPAVIETKEQIAILEKEVAQTAKQPTNVEAPADSAAGLINQRIKDYQHAIAETPAHEEAIAAVNRDYAILTSRYNDLSNLYFQASADQAVLERGQGRALAGASVCLAAD